MRNNTMKIGKAHWYRLGGFANSALFRRADKRGRWQHFVDMDHPSAEGIFK